jgi:peptide/nickel transport system permease protein
MVRYLTRRVLWALALFFVVTLVTYIIFFLIPVDPARNACGQRPSQICIELATKTLGLDKPIYVQYARYLWRLTYHLDLGRSFETRQSVNQIVKRAAPVTASLAIGGMIVMILIAFPIGILSALRPRSKLDRASMTFALAGVSIPSFWTGLVALYLVSFKLGWTPIGQYCDLRHNVVGCHGLVQWSWHLVLPWVVFGTHHSAIYIRMIRGTLMEAMNEDYVKTARAKGATERRVVWGHAMRNAILPIVTMLGMDFGFVLGGLFFLEFVFGLPGLGLQAIQSINAFDLPVTTGIVVFGTTAILLCNLIVDLLYAAIDPRIRLA